MLPDSQSAPEAEAYIDREIAELNEAIGKLQARINALSTQRNTLSLVHRFPPEILSAIFIQCASSQERRKSTLLSETGGVPDWVNVSYVCRHWRDVALKCPTLWTYMFSVSGSWTQELLSRSKTAPLRVRLECSMQQPWKMGLQQVLAHTGRIQDLHLEISFRDHENSFPLFSSPAPLLQSLVLYALHLGNPLHIWPFFDGVTPSLRQLKLYGCFIPQPSSMLCNLTTLILQSSKQLTMGALEDILHSARGLVHLELAHALLRDAEDSLDGQETSRLPHLLRLSIAEPSYNVITLLRRLNISSQTEVKLRVSQLTSVTWGTLRLLLAQRILTSRDNPPSFLIVTIACMHSLAASRSDIYDTYDWKSDSDWDCKIPLEISLDGRVEWMQDIIQDAHHGGFLTDIKSVTLKNDPKIDGTSSDFSRLSEDILGHLPELRYIRLINANITLSVLFSFLTPQAHRHDEDHKQNDLVDRFSGMGIQYVLEELVIGGSRFDPQAAEPEDHTHRVSDLYNALATRKEKGYALNRLALTGCFNLFEEDVATLKNVVAEVVWDGLEEVKCYFGSPEPEYEIADTSLSGETTGDSVDSDLEEDSLENEDAGGDSANESPESPRIGQFGGRFWGY